MCGLVGYYVLEASLELQQQILVPLIKESKIRGLHAFGISYYGESGHVLKKFHDLQQLLDLVQNQLIFDAIVHTRYSTSGDYEVMDNNQPLDISGYSLAFNGVIDMRTKEEMEQAYSTTMETANDGELFIQHLRAGGDPIQFVRDCGSFAGIWYDSVGEMYALRNPYRPLWYLRESNFTIFASTQDIIRRALGEIAAGFAVECVPYKLYKATEVYDNQQ